MIDTGEKENVVVQYLLDRKIKTLDYLIISHFDSDHCAIGKEIIEKLSIKNIVVSIQAEKTSLFESFIESAEKKKINIILVKAGDIIKIDNEVDIKILWPINNQIIKENQINNNSMVCKMTYGKFSMLFTGDIEKIAEENMISKYSEQELSSNILKIAHHGSKTSSIEELIKKINPQISLIGVGKNNKFGHPNESTIECLKKNGSIVYRTDLSGEITIKVKQNSKIKIYEHIK